ncbi:MAG TPA: PDZ domain-containing protein [Anaerolineae bacterium]|nr:PDZ domain-containing protein [Anaerolineae bacterium]
MRTFKGFERLGELRREGRNHAGLWYLPPYILSLLTFALLAVSSWVITWPGDGVSWALPEGRILAVDSYGPGGLAGLKPGDVVVSIDGRVLSGTPLYAGARPGQQVVLGVQRGGRISDIRLTLDSPTAADLLWRLVPVVVGLSFWLGGVVLFVLRPKSSPCQAFFLFCQGAAVTLATGQISAVNVGWAAQLFHLSLLALAPLQAHFYEVFVAADRPAMRAWVHWLAALCGLLALPQAAAVVLSLFEHRVTLFPLTWPPWRLGVRLYLGATLSAIMVGLLVTYFSTRSASVRRKLRGLAVGTSIGVLPLLLFSLAPDMLGGTGAGLPYQVSFLFLIMIPLSHAYLIFRHDLVPLDRFLNRSLVVFSLGLTWAGVYLAAVGTSLLFFRDTPLLYPLVGALVTVGLAALLNPVRSRIQRVVDRLFYRGWYDYRTVIAEVSLALSTVTSRRELAERLVAPVAEGLRLRGAALYLRTPEGDLELTGSREMEVPERLPIAAVSPEAFGQPLSQEGERGMVSRVAWRFPLVQDGRPTGLLLLGEKREDNFLEPADAEILRTLAQQASLAAAKVLLMDELRQAMKALEAGQRRMLTAREEERRVLAWKLHDGPVQDLLALGYRLHECRELAWPHDRSLAEALELARRETTEIMAVLREACSDLRSDVLDVMGLGPAVIQHARDVMRKTGIVVYLDVPRRGPKLADPLGITLLRVFQEALGNAVQHANVREVWTSLQMQDGMYELKVWDEGKGFMVPDKMSLQALKGHFGLVTMMERMAAVGGALEIHSGPGKGTQVRAWGAV